MVVHIAACEGKPCIQQLYMLYTTGYACCILQVMIVLTYCILQVIIVLTYCILQVMIVLELLVNGDLRNYLIKNRPRYLTLDIKCYLSAASIVQCMHY